MKLRSFEPMERAADPSFDVAIVGGGPAGLAAALVLGRMRRRVLLLDADDPAHARSDAVHGFFAHDGIPPLELRRIGREELRRYDTVMVRIVEVEHVSSTSDGFSVRAAGTTSEAGVVLPCSGMRYEPPRLEGLAELWPHRTTAPTATAGSSAAVGSRSMARRPRISR